MNKPTIQEAFHKLWTKTVGTDGYDKKEWLDLEQHIIRLEKLEPESQKPHGWGLGWP